MKERVENVGRIANDDFIIAEAGQNGVVDAAEHSVAGIVPENQIDDFEIANVDGNDGEVMRSFGETSFSLLDKPGSSAAELAGIERRIVCVHLVSSGAHALKAAPLVPEKGCQWFESRHLLQAQRSGAYPNIVGILTK